MKLNKQFLGGAAVLAASVLSANPMVVTDVSMSQDSGYTTLTVNYTLTADNPAFVRLDLLTNNVSIGTENIKTVSGDGYSTDTDALISQGAHKIVWQAKADWPDHVSSNAQARVLAYYTNHLDHLPGVYMVVDLSDGPNAASYPISYTLTPPDPTDVTCCSNQLWLKRVETNTFEMGSATNEAGHQANETLHEVTLTNAFFIGVFPVTRAQYKLVMGSVHSDQSGDSTLCPVNLITYNDLRGAKTNTADNIDWPDTKYNVLSNSFFGVLRSKTGGSLRFDLPTEAEWECACRAGTATAWNDGSNFETNSLYVDENLDKLGWYWNRSSAAGMAKPVGKKAPNAWGLYDCHGNVWEWCLDYTSTLSAEAVTEPVGVRSGAYRVLRGGSWSGGAQNCRSATRRDGDPSGWGRSFGFRAALVIGQ